MWLMYSETRNEVYKLAAIRSEKLIGNALKDFKKLHHDVGFMWHILSGANYRLTGNTKSRNLNLYMAAAIKILKATDSSFCNYSEDDDSIVQMGSERYPVNGDMSGVHIPIIYGDFFFAEAILKLKGSKFLIW